jgi:Domain of unknown function (DUF4276)
MAKYVIVPIVEGRGEVDAVPILLRGWLKFRKYRTVEVHSAGPVYAGGKGNIAAAHDPILGKGVEHYVRLAWLRQPRVDVILILLDADKDCPAALAAALFARAPTMIPPNFPIDVVVANTEYEAWFLAAFPSARFRRALEVQGFRLRQRSLPRGMDVEAIADCKARIETLVDVSYKPTKHQPALTQVLPFSRGMTRRSRSFRKLIKELHELLMKTRRRRSASDRGPFRGDSPSRVGRP